MVNEDILTVLRNAVDHGEPLQQAIQILINSGYDPQQVQEASRYVQGGSMQNLQPNQDERLVMAQNKSIFSKNKINPAQTPQMQNQQMQQNLPQNQNISPQLPNQQIQKIPIQSPTKPIAPISTNPSNQSRNFAENPMNRNELQQLTQPAPKQSTPLIQNQTQKPISNQQNTQTRMQLPEQKVDIKRKSHKKEIILLIILVLLIGVLASTIIFREGILSFLSG